MLELPDVTLVMVELAGDELAARAADDCTRNVRFGDQLLLENDPEWSKLDWCQYIWHDIPYRVKTAFMLLCQWDAGVWDVGMWKSAYLDYDYIGAPWWWHTTRRVGNSGFALKSTRLARYLADRAWDFPCDTAVEDDLLCRKYRPRLEERGFRWAPDKLAHDFAFESCRSSEKAQHFGYHSMANWPIVLSPEEVRERYVLAKKVPFYRGQVKFFEERWPNLVKEIGNECDLGV